MIINITATVSSEGKLDFNCEVDHKYSFEQVRAALMRVRDELDRQISAGPRVCPYKDHQGDDENPRVVVPHQRCSDR